MAVSMLFLACKQLQMLPINIGWGKSFCLWEDFATDFQESIYMLHLKDSYAKTTHIHLKDSSAKTDL